MDDEEERRKADRKRFEFLVQKASPRQLEILEAIQRAAAAGLLDGQIVWKVTPKGQALIEKESGDDNEW